MAEVLRQVLPADGCPCMAWTGMSTCSCSDQPEEPKVDKSAKKAAALAEKKHRLADLDEKKHRLAVQTRIENLAQVLYAKKGSPYLLAVAPKVPWLDCDQKTQDCWREKARDMLFRNGVL